MTEQLRLGEAPGDDQSGDNQPTRADGPAGEIRIDPDAWDPHMDPAATPQIVVGGPGTGKTEFLIRRIESAIDTDTPPSDIVVLTFSRDSVIDLRTRLFERLGSASYQVNVSTYHSLAHRILEAGFESAEWTSAPTVLAGPEHERFVAEVLESENPEDWHRTFRPILTSPAFASELTDFVLRFHEQGGRVDDLERSAIPEWRGIAGFLRRYEMALRERGRIDYGKLLNDAVRIVRDDPDRFSPYRHVLADEYQDTSPIQADLLLALASPSGSLTVAADPYQSIYSFRGSDINNVLDFPARTADSLGTTAQRLILTTSFRVPPQILDAAVNVTGRELPGAAGKVLSQSEGGVVATHVFDNPDAESDWIAADIERAHLAEGFPLHRIAVFTRDAGEMHQRLATALERRGIPHGLTDEQLNDQPVVRLVDDLVAIAKATEESDVAERDELIRSILLGSFIGAPTGTVNEMIRRVEAGQEWPDVIRTLLPAQREFAHVLEDRRWATDLPATEGLWWLWEHASFLHNIAVDDDATPHRRAWSAFFQSVERFGERTEGATLADRAYLAGDSEIEADALFSFRTNSASGVTIGTLHRSKGTEYDIVYVAHAVEGLLPDLRAKDSILKTRLLNENLPEDPVEYVQFRLNEERRLAYTAMTRATRRVVWTATEIDSPSEQLEPSRFLPQVAAPSEPGRYARPLTRRGYEAFLRRTLRDIAAPATERLASLEVLARAAEIGLTDQRTRYGVVAHGSDSGFVPNGHTTSPSQATTYDECPRRYVMERFASHKESDSVYMRFGNLIHKVLEIAERRALDAGRARSTIDEAEAVLTDVWEELGFGDDGVGVAWRLRAMRTLTHLYEKWPRSAEPRFLERTVEADLDGTPWRGKIDRVETSDGKVNIVDYKTSNTAATKDEAASSLQLGFYLLAAMDDPEITALGDVSGAEFWYPSPNPLKNAIVTRSFDMANLDAVRDRLVEVAMSIQDEVFPAIVNSRCDRCDFLDVCPAQPEGQEAFVS